MAQNNIIDIIKQAATDHFNTKCENKVPIKKVEIDDSGKGSILATVFYGDTSITYQIFGDIKGGFHVGM